MDNVVFEARLVAKGVPIHIQCVRENADKVACIINDLHKGQKIAEFQIHKDLMVNIPQILELYLAH